MFMVGLASRADLLIRDCPWPMYGVRDTSVYEFKIIE